MRDIIKRITTYNLYMIWENVISGVYTKVFWKNARLVRYPIRVYGKRRMSYGNDLTIGANGRIDIVCQRQDDRPCLVIGENCVFGADLHIAANYRVTIGNNLLAASRVFITDSNHGNYSNAMLELAKPNTAPVERKLFCKETHIGDNVWLGENVCVLAGANIGNGVVVASNAVVKGEIPDNCIIGGIPARVIKYYGKYEE